MAALCVVVWTARRLEAQAPANTPAVMAAEFERSVKPFLEKNCVRCHNADNPTAGVRVDQLDATMADRHIRVWEGVKHRVANGTMPPKGLPQPAVADRDKATQWIGQMLEVARLRPTPKNGMVRRLTVAQYRNTLRELLLLEDDLTEILPPDAISADGFVNNKETLQLSPLLIEAYLELADEALNRSIVDPARKPVVQNFRMELGRGVNKAPLAEELVLGANSELLENADFVVTQLTPAKPFAFEPFRMRTHYRFIEGYRGNDTVRGWREFDSIYHSVFADMRGSRGYPKGKAYGTVPEGLLLRPAIPNDELFTEDGTYGPKANFKISLRELPDNGRFRVTVMAAKYDDGLMLEKTDAAREPSAAGRVEWKPGTAEVTLSKAGVYQVDVHAEPRNERFPKPDATRLSEGLGGAWTFETSDKPAALDGDVRPVKTPFGQGVRFDGEGDSVSIPRPEALQVGEGDFTVAAWIRPGGLRKAGLISLGMPEWTHGWFLELADNRGTLRLETSRPDNESNGAVASPAGVIVPNQWQHVAAVVKRGTKDTTLYVNGYAVARGEIGKANLDNPRLKLVLGRLGKAQSFKGVMDEVRIYTRALAEAELQALIEAGREHVKAPPEKPQDEMLTLGGREFTGALPQAAFVAVRLPAGKLPVKAEWKGARGLERVVFTPLAESDAVARRFAVFEKRSPRLGVHLGLRRDCGSTLFPVGTPRVVKSGALTKFVFEGAIRNYPSPDVEKDNVNYLAGVREIGVRSEYTDGRDMPRLLIRSVEFEGPFYDQWPPASHRNLFVESPRKGETREYAREVIRQFAARAYRRPVKADEERALLAVFDKARAAGGSYQAGVKDALQVVLTSPQFLFLVETSATPKPEPLDEYELASKLSYFLWNGPPDRTAMRLARNGTLRQQLNAEVDRMVADARFGRFTQEFVSQWLSLDKFQVVEPDKKQFPDLTRDAKAQLKREPVEFVQHLIRQNLPVSNLIRSDFVMTNEVVATYYGMGARTESGFQFVPVAHGRKELGGVLSQASILAGLSDGRESNPVKRGAWLARRIVAEPPADPPPNVPALGEDATGLTLRQRLEQHRNVAACRQCHLKIDPWGVALEEFDASGRWKSHPVDASSTLPDQATVNGALDLKRYLSEDRIDQVAFSVLKHLATYATGRSLTYNELNYLKTEGPKLKATGYRMKDMVRFVAASLLFLEK